MKKEIKYFFTKIYNNGELLKNIVSSKQIKQINNVFKKNHDKFNDFSEFENSFPIEFDLLKKSPAAYLEVKKQFNRRLGLQPAILSECFMTQTIANALSMSNFYDYDNPSIQLPQNLVSVIFKFVGKRDNSTYRYIYSDNDAQNILIQCGSSTSIDVYFIKNFKAVRIEYKEKDSKLGEFDLTQGYDENGKLIITDEFRNTKKQYVKFIEMFNEKTNIFEQQGHNWQLFKDSNYNDVKIILEENFINKEIDLYCFLVGEKIIPILPKYLFENSTFDGSEIRTAGRNPTSPGKAFTYGYIRNLIEKKNGQIIENIVKIPLSSLKPEKARGGDDISRYKLSSLVFVYKDDKDFIVLENDGIAKFPMSSIRQLKPSISIHLHPKLDKESLAKQLIEFEK